MFWLARIVGWRQLLQWVQKESLDPDPVKQFERWFQTARRVRLPLPNAMTLSTAADGIAAARVVLLKQVDAEGFVYYTNYESRKGREVEKAPRVALTFYWPGLERQVRIQGTAEKTPRELSERYFASRPRQSQLAAWASDQSAPAEGREEMDQRYAKFEKQYAGGKVPCPPHWGGYRVRPERIEFWQGRPFRFHDRFEYVKVDPGWALTRLNP